MPLFGANLSTSKQIEVITMNNHLYIAWFATLSHIGDSVDLPIAEAKELDFVVKEFFVAANINPQSFLSNIAALSLGGEPTVFDQSTIGQDTLENYKPTKSLASVLFIEDRPPCYPLWFLAAYPDVCKWLHSKMHKYLETHPRDYNGWETVSLKLLGVDLNNQSSEEDFISKTGKYRPLILRNLANSYKNDTRKYFETGKHGLFNFWRYNHLLLAHGVFNLLYAKKVTLIIKFDGNEIYAPGRFLYVVCLDIILCD